jgi:hypothetical protein
MLKRAKMARPRKPTRHLELTGAFRKDPKRKRVDPETRPDIGDPPPALAVHLHAIWYELADAAPLGVLTHSDRPMLEAFTRWQHKSRTATGWTAADAAALGWFFVRCGMSPSDRSRVHAPERKVKNPFDQFAAKARAARKTH